MKPQATTTLTQTGGAKKRVGRRDEHPATPHGSERCNASPAQHQQQWRLALADRCNVNVNVKGSDPLPTRVTLRYTCCASTQGERGGRTRRPRQRQRSLRERQRQTQRSLR